MTSYFLTIIFMVIFSSAAQTIRRVETNNGLSVSKPASKTTSALLVAAVLPLIFTAGFRFEVGTDFNAYYKADQVFGGHVWEKIKTLNEPGISILVAIINFFSKDGGVYIFVFSFLTIFPTTYVLLRRSGNYTVILLLYVFTGCWHGSFNGVRQYLAATVIMLGHRYILDKKFVKYAITVLIAYCFHSSAVVMLVLYFIMRGKINYRNIFLLALGTILVAGNYETIFSFIGLLKDKDVVMDTYATASVNTLRVLANCAPAILAVALYINKHPDREQTFYINGLIVNAAAMIAASNSTYLARISIYTTLFIPAGLPKLIRFEDKRLERLLWFVIIALFAVFWYYEVSEYPSLNQFKWVWERNIIEGVS